MKKIIVCSLLIAGIAATNSSFAQDAKDRKATRKETKMNKKEEKTKK